jgi:hypothetical protein
MPSQISYLSCLKKTGPGDTIFMATAIKANSGNKNNVAIKAHRTSRERFHAGMRKPKLEIGFKP